MHSIAKSLLEAPSAKISTTPRLFLGDVVARMLWRITIEVHGVSLLQYVLGHAQVDVDVVPDYVGLATRR